MEVNSFLIFLPFGKQSHSFFLPCVIFFIFSTYFLPLSFITFFSLQTLSNISIHLFFFPRAVYDISNTIQPEVSQKNILIKNANTLIRLIRSRAFESYSHLIQIKSYVVKYCFGF